MANIKGQTQQVFIYILVILIVGAVLLFGYKSINKLIKQSCDVDQTSFQIDVKTKLDDYSGYGDEGPAKLKAPCGYTLLCFSDSDRTAIEDTSQVELVNKMMYNEIVSGTGNNVFLIKGNNDIIAIVGYDNIVVPGNDTAKGFTCIDAKSGTFYFRLEGVGKGKVKVTPGS